MTSRPSKNLVMVRPDVLGPDPLRQTQQRQQEADRHHDLDDFGGALEPPHDHAFDHGAEDRGDDEHHEHDATRPRRPTPAALLGRGVHLPVHERRHHAERAVREVEDARGRVGDDEPAGRDGVHRRDRDAGDGEVRNLSMKPGASSTGGPLPPVPAGRNLGNPASADRSAPSDRSALRDVDVPRAEIARPRVDGGGAGEALAVVVLGVRARGRAASNLPFLTCTSIEHSAGRVRGRVGCRRAGRRRPTSVTSAAWPITQSRLISPSDRRTPWPTVANSSQAENGLVGQAATLASGFAASTTSSSCWIAGHLSASSNGWVRDPDDQALDGSGPAASMISSSYGWRRRMRTPS